MLIEKNWVMWTQLRNFFYFYFFTVLTLEEKKNEPMFWKLMIKTD